MLIRVANSNTVRSGDVSVQETQQLRELRLSHAGQAVTAYNILYKREFDEKNNFYVESKTEN